MRKINIPRQYEIHGSMLRIFKYCKNNKVFLKQKMLSPTALRLWFHISDGQFDEDLWNDLDDAQQKFLVYAHREMRFPENRQLEIALSKKTIGMQNRLKLLEGNIMNGNLNKDLIDEASTIINELKAMSVLSAQQATRYQLRLNKLYDSIDRSQGSQS